MHNPKRVILREELKAITGDSDAAMALGQFLYWVTKKNDFEDWWREEQTRDPDTEAELGHGWIWKSITELHEELMLSISERTLGRRVDNLVEAGWLNRRKNPKDRRDHTWQYRPNLHTIRHSLAEAGYTYPTLEEMFAQLTPGRGADPSPYDGVRF